MSELLDRLSLTSVILCSFVAMLLTGWGFGVFSDRVGGVYLDELLSADAARALIAGMSAAQRSAHFWITVLLDTLYPIVYGAFAVGLLSRLSRNWRRWAVLPALAAVVADYLENTVQALALVGFESLLRSKDLLTPIKFSGLGLSLVLILGFGLWRLLQRLKSGTQISVDPD